MWMCRHNGYTGMSLFDGMVGSGYNLVTTSMPIFVVALTDRDLTDETVLNHPETYIFSQRGVHLSHTNFATWAGGALWNSMVLYFTMMYALSEPDSQGREMDLHMISMAVFASLHVQVGLNSCSVAGFWEIILLTQQPAVCCRCMSSSSSQSPPGRRLLPSSTCSPWPRGLSSGLSTRRCMACPGASLQISGPCNRPPRNSSEILRPNGDGAARYTFVNVTSDLRFWLALALSVFICVLSDIAAKFIWRNFEHL